MTHRTREFLYCKTPGAVTPPGVRRGFVSDSKRKRAGGEVFVSVGYPQVYAVSVVRVYTSPVDGCGNTFEYGRFFGGSEKEI